MSFFVYILFSDKLNRFYIGSCQDIEIRLKEHLWKHTGFTAKAKDWKLVYSEQQPSKSLALQREKKIKNWKSRIMIMKLIDNSNA